MVSFFTEKFLKFNARQFKKNSGKNSLTLTQLFKQNVAILFILLSFNGGMSSCRTRRTYNSKYGICGWRHVVNGGIANVL